MTLCVDDLYIVNCWLGTSYAVQEGCMVQTVAMMSLDNGAVTNFSRRGNIQDKSST